MPEGATPFAAVGGGVRVAVHLRPKASVNAVAGMERDAQGKAWLQVRVSAAPEKGKANAALIKLLARHWGLSPGRLSLAAGAKSRRKTVLIEGEARALLQILEKSL